MERKKRCVGVRLPHLVDESHEDGADDAGQTAGCREEAHPEALGEKSTKLLLSALMKKKSQWLRVKDRM